MKRDSKLWVLLAGCVALALVGCEVKNVPPTASSADTPQPPTMPGPPAVMPGPPAAAPAPAASAEGVVVGGQGLPENPMNLAPANDTPGAPAEPTVPAVVPDPPSTPTEVVKAEKGVAAQGRSLDQYEGIIVTPAKAYFAVREKVVFEISIPGAYKLYRATEEPPLTFDEFKEKVLDPNKIKLPMLPPGATYEWDPEKEELQVRRPRPQP